MKKSIKKLLFLLQVLGWSALVATACTDNQVKTTTKATDNSGDKKGQSDSTKLNGGSDKDTDHVGNDKDGSHEKGVPTKQQSSEKENTNVNPQATESKNKPDEEHSPKAEDHKENTMGSTHEGSDTTTHPVSNEGANPKGQGKPETVSSTPSEGGHGSSGFDTEETPKTSTPEKAQ